MKLSSLPGLVAAGPAVVLVLLAACTARPAGEGPAGVAAAALAPASASPPSIPVETTVARHDASAGAELSVTHARSRIVPTGHFDVHVWGGAVNTGTLLDKAGLGAVPVSEARFLWGDDALYFFFYAGDLDLQAHATRHDGPVWNDDSVALTFPAADGTRRIIQISVMGTVADGSCPADAAGLADPRCDLGWESGVQVGTDFDGTVNHVGDRDEEWAVEAAIPLAAIGARGTAGTRVALSINRCEIAYDGRRACGSWGSPAGGVLAFQDR
ncbi:MAG TPA: hypothetical protein VK762_13500 [Polyangiaceae bacterium]|nr:hypothetical protein [Polyangiaceae bacterium]